MINFFTKKKYLVDSLEGFIDIHNHILPGIDDGAKTVEDSISLIKGFSEFGVTKFIATPHIMHDYYPNNPESIDKSLSILKTTLIKNNMSSVDINAAAEHMIDSNFETLLEEGCVLPLNKSYLLVEMSYLQPAINFDEAIQKIATNRYFPILAHPERYVFLQKKLEKYKTIKENGILFQMNILSLSNYYGKEVQQTALKLLDAGLINFIASDVHNIHQLNCLKEIKMSSKMLNIINPLIQATIYNFG